MRLKINFYHPEKSFITLPCHYNEAVQGFIYHHLEVHIARELHDRGFKDPETKRRFKFFTFSRLIPEDGSQIKDGRIYLHGNINLVISSPLNDFIQSFAMNLMKSGEFMLAGERMILASVQVEALPEYREKIYVKTLSPITVYSTLNTPDGRKKTYYYSPFEREFEKLIIDNLNKKMRTLMEKTAQSGSVKPFRVSSGNQRVVMYKHTVIKGWDGVFELALPPELFALAFDTGLGAKNSLGFGCIELWRSERGGK
ncbi:CRISPR-associated endoribonuclease Cas6 [Thermodesulfovibrio sp. 3907-1M]|uniref:CRISPR-associated endoribonuclease n=1 Tax=Thermodesulfovibrio autotrophicus TaxID=3118333 RepID=A0AAU8GZF4_9BACT